MLILNTVPRKFRVLFNSHCAEPSKLSVFVLNSLACTGPLAGQVFKLERHHESLLGVRENIPFIPHLFGFVAHGSWNTGKSLHQMEQSHCYHPHNQYLLYAMPPSEYLQIRTPLIFPMLIGRLSLSPLYRGRN